MQAIKDVSIYLPIKDYEENKDILKPKYPDINNPSNHYILNTDINTISAQDILSDAIFLNLVR